GYFAAQFFSNLAPDRSFRKLAPPHTATGKLPAAAAIGMANQQHSALIVAGDHDAAVHRSAPETEPVPPHEEGEPIKPAMEWRGYQTKHVTDCVAAASRRATGRSLSPRAAASNRARFSAPRATNKSSSESNSAGIVSVIRLNGASGGSGSGVSCRMRRLSSAR